MRLSCVAVLFLWCCPIMASETADAQKAGSAEPKSGESTAGQLNWDEKCSKHQKVVPCIQIYKPVECRIGDLAASGSNLCFAEHNLIVKVCERQDRSMYQYGPMTCTPLLIGK